MTKHDDTSGVHLWLLLSRCFRAVSAHASESIDGLALGYTDFAILEALLHKGPLLVSELGRKVLLTSGSITSAVDRLQARGFVLRKQDDDDKRARRVRLTLKGRALIEKAFLRHAADMETAAAALAPKDREALTRLLRAWGRSVARSDADDPASQG